MRQKNGRIPKELSSFGGVRGKAPRRTQSHKRLTKWYVAGTKNGGAGPHFSKKRMLSVPGSFTKTSNPVQVPRGSAPWRGLGQPQKNFAYTVGEYPLECFWGRIPIGLLPDYQACRFRACTYAKPAGNTILGLDKLYHEISGAIAFRRNFQAISRAGTQAQTA